VHDLIPKVSIQQYLYQDEHVSVQSLSEPRMLVNPLAASFDEQTRPLDESLRKYMSECKERGRSVYILCLAHFLQRVSVPDASNDFTAETMRFVDYLAALFNQRTMLNSRLMTTDYLPSAVVKRRRTNDIDCLEKLILLQRECGIEEGYRPMHCERV